MELVNRFAMKDNLQFILVMVTVGSESEGAAIASALVESSFAACVKMFPVSSTYRWQGQVQQDQEWQLLIKTQTARFEAVESLVRSHHSYEVPEIIAIPVTQGSAPYLSWIQQQTSS